MKIVIDFRMFSSEFGLGRYNQKLLENMISLDNTDQYVLLFQSVPVGLVLPPNWQIKIVKYHWYSLAEQIFLPIILWRLRPDLVHFPHFNVPIFYRGKFIVTIHDLIMTKFPSRRGSTLNSLSFIIKRWAYQLTIRRAVKGSVAIIAVSNFTAQDIITYFALDQKQSQKIKVIYEGVTIMRPKVGSALQLPEKFFLYVGNAYPHKNLEFLIKVFKDFLAIYPDYYLVLGGSKNYFYRRLETWTAELMGGQKKHVLFPGFLPDHELAHYYSKASAYVFPSKYEGFGLPPLEAMNFDLPVLSSNVSCLPEILGQAALYFDPDNAQDLLNKMEIIIKSQSVRDNLISHAREQIKKYDWRNTARQTLELYKNC